MKSFELDSSMLSLAGAFYPTGHMFLMFPSEQEARDAGKKLQDGGFTEDSLTLLTPEDVLEKIVRTAADSGALPSAGTESDTVRQFAQLASQGHYALLVHAPDADQSDLAMKLLQGSGLSYGQKYRMLVIEDLV
ncbi:RNA-binding protein [Caenimonas koreensis DSM 17982]|uniref:RNA-binding protein n=1 Tax=Caenimonas koreensis DSM 17982 TaxID=1121255 RepID=A0A844AU37_9BURK|nr:RNA-binding protein [Caenimonas koreensis]MRD45868.1 RNA-binding protein [Caenimonas koreensis DSM 17982]